MTKEEPIELISHIKAIFYFLGGLYIPEINDIRNEISIMKIALENKNIQEDHCVTLSLIEERINSIQGVDPRLRLSIAKILPKVLSKNMSAQSQVFENKKCVYVTFDEFLDSLRDECELLELE